MLKVVFQKMHVWEKSIYCSLTGAIKFVKISVVVLCWYCASSVSLGVWPAWKFLTVVCVLHMLIVTLSHMLIVTLGRLLQRKYTTCSVKSKSWSKLNLKVEASPQMKHFQMVIKFYQASKFCPTFVEVSISKSKMAHSDWVDF